MREIYKVLFKADEVMPEGQDWVLAHSAVGVTVLYLRESILRREPAEVAAALEETWAAFRKQVQRIPEQRRFCPLHHQLAATG